MTGLLSIPMVPMGKIPTHGNIPTLWDWSLGFWGVWRNLRYRALIEELQPDGLQLHGGVGSLLSYAPAVCQEIRAAMPDVDLWLGVAGDGNKTDCDVRWPAAMALAVDCGAKALVLNFEGSAEYPWREEKHGTKVRAALAKCREIGDKAGVALGHTSWPRAQPSYYGFPYVWESALGGEVVPDFTHPQVYGPGRGMNGPGGMRAQLDKCTASYDKAEADGQIHAVERGLYLGAYHGHTPAGTCHLAQRTHSACYWVVGAPMYPADERALRACCKLWRLGFHGVTMGPDWPELTEDGVEVDGIVDYQRSQGLGPDGVVGPMTLGALSIQ